jgi:hypothetical protein
MVGRAGGAIERHDLGWMRDGQRRRYCRRMSLVAVRTARSTLVMGVSIG